MELMENELEKAAVEFEKLHGQQIFIEVKKNGNKHLCIEAFKAGANYSNSLGPVSISNGLDCKMISIDNELTYEIDWEQRRYELAKAAISGLYAREDEGDISKFMVSISKDLLLVVDELIRQLKE